MSSAPRGAAHPVRIALAIAIVTGAIYSQVLSLDFVRFDDPAFVQENPYVLAGLTWESVRLGFPRTMIGNWIPLTMLSHQLDIELFGLNPAMHHATSALIHACTTGLVFLFVAGFRRRGEAAFVALAFGLHPAHVESVAWVSERKDVLCAFFYVLALLLWLRPGIRRTLAGRLLVFFVGLLALSSKPMAATLPASLLLLDLFILDRRREGLFPLFMEKLPLSALNLVFFFQNLVDAPEPVVPSLGYRVQLSLVGYAHYFRAAFMPGDLAFFYAKPASFATSRILIAATAIGAALSVMAASWKIRAVPYGILFFFVALLPVIGIAGAIWDHAYADRYQYIPSIGLFIALAAISERVTRPVTRTVVGVLAGLYCTWLAAGTFQQIPVWTNTLTLAQHALDVGSPSERAHTLVGTELSSRGRHADAIHHYREAIRLGGDAHLYLASALRMTGDLGGARASYAAALDRAPDSALAHHGLAVTLGDLGVPAAALTHAVVATRIAPASLEYRVTHARLLEENGRHAEAVALLDNIVRASDARLFELFSAGSLFIQSDERGRAAVAWSAAVSRFPDAVDAWAALAWHACTDMPPRGEDTARSWRELSARVPSDALVMALEVCVAAAQGEPARADALAALVSRSAPSMNAAMEELLDTKSEGARGQLLLHHILTRAGEAGRRVRRSAMP